MKLIEILIAVPAIIGSLLVATLSQNLQLTGFTLWIIANTAGLIFCIKNKFYFLMIQYGFFLITAIYGIFNRL